MDDARTDAVPLASAAAWSPTAAPAPDHRSRVLTLDAPPAGAPAARHPAPEAASLPASAPVARPERLAALREIARRLHSSPGDDPTLQAVVDLARSCTGSDAVMLTLQPPLSRQYVSGSALGAGPYISVPLRNGGPSFGELVLTRMAEGAPYATEDELFAELASEHVAEAVAALRAGTVVGRDAQDFIDRVTQELRSPLAGARNTLRAVLDDDAEALSEGVRRHLEPARADVERLLGSVEDLIALGHLRAPDLRDMEAVPVTPWMQRIVDRFRGLAQRRGVTLTHRPPPEAYVVQGVAEQLDVALGHLVANAVKFTEPGGRVDVTAGPLEDLVRVSVRDTGIGFDAADADRMTECFARALTAEAARIPGLGLGLHLAEAIVKFHHGRLWLESRRDEGTQAHLALPARAG